MAAPAGGLDPQALAGRERAGRLGLDRPAVEQIDADGPVLPAVGAARRVTAALGDQRELHRLERLELADDAVAAAVSPGAARAAAALERTTRSG